MQRTLQGSNGRGDSGINIGQGGNGYTGCEGRCIQLMVRMQHQRLVESLHCYRVRLLAGEHVQEVLRNGGAFLGCYRVQPLADTGKCGNNGGNLGLQLDSLLYIGGYAHISGFRII
ncbi:hypothetical protein D3C81_1614720 [compost metagenome]